MPMGQAPFSMIAPTLSYSFQLVGNGIPGVNGVSFAQDFQWYCFALQGLQLPCSVLYL